MGTGDTIAGNVRIVREDAEGNTVRVFGPESQNRLDSVNENTSASEKLYANTQRSSRKGKPGDAENVEIPDAIWESGEKLFVQHKADSDVANNIDSGKAGAFEIGVVEQDLNRNNFFPGTLRSTDNEISNDAQEETDQWVSFFEFTVPDRERLYLAGRLMATAVEN